MAKKTSKKTVKKPTELNNVNNNPNIWDRYKNTIAKRRVMIATPCHSGKLEAWYTNSLIQTERFCSKNNIEIEPIFVCFEALVEKARNDLFAYAYETKVDDLFYIDADISWTPQNFMQILSHPVDFVSGVYPKKTDIEDFPVNLIGESVIKNGLIEVASVPSGFLRLSKNAIETLWNASAPYTINQDVKIFKQVFQTAVLGGRFISEDIIACIKWRELGNKVYLDPNVSVFHIGNRVWKNNFMEFLKRATIVKEDGTKVPAIKNEDNSSPKKSIK